MRYEIQEFISCIVNKRFSSARLRRKESICMAQVMEQFMNKENFLRYNLIDNVMKDKSTYCVTNGFDAKFKPLKSYKHIVFCFPHANSLGIVRAIAKED